METATGLIKLKIDNNLIEDNDYKEKMVIKFEQLVSDNKHNLCLIQLPHEIVRYTFTIYGDKGFISTGSCKINNQSQKEHFIHSFVYHIDELYCIHIQSFYNDDSYDDFIQFINNNINNVDVKIKKIHPPKEPITPPPTKNPIKSHNESILAKFMQSPPPSPLPTAATTTNTVSVVSFNKRTGRKAYTIATPESSDDDQNDQNMLSKTDYQNGKDNDNDNDNDDKEASESEVKDIMKEIDLLHDDVFNSTVKSDEEVILS